MADSELNCSVCLTMRWKPEELKQINIFVNGSEGIKACPDCDNALTNHVQAMRSIAARSKLAALDNTKPGGGE